MRSVKLPLALASLGYFVDIYDLILFSIVRIKSLKAIGVAGDALLSDGVRLLSMQMAGMLLGGILWGILGDKKGRLSVLLGSILLYSTANIANGFVHSVEAYAWLRFVAGLGLAGELGAGITLVSEVMPKEIRGYGTTMVATVGILGGVVAALVGDFFDWRTAYFVGGGMGLLLLTLRIGAYESGLFEQVKKSAVVRGDFRTIFATRERVVKYVCSILIGVPIWCVVGILITFSPEFGKALGMPVLPNPAMAVLLCYAGCSAGDLASGLLSQALASRKKTVLVFLLATAALTAVFLTTPRGSLAYFYTMCGALGFACGYWAVFMTMASEQFGTNIRATVTTTTPNFVRGSLVALTPLFERLKAPLGILGSAGLVASLTVVLALAALSRLDETFGKDLDYCD